MGNLSPDEFALRVGTEFTDNELSALRGYRSGLAKLTGPDDFHIFDSPIISVTVGSAESVVLDIFTAANERSSFNRQVDFDLDSAWRGEQ